MPATSRHRGKRRMYLFRRHKAAWFAAALAVFALVTSAIDNAGTTPQSAATPAQQPAAKVTIGAFEQDPVPTEDPESGEDAAGAEQSPDGQASPTVVASTTRTSPTPSTSRSVTRRPTTTRKSTTRRRTTTRTTSAPRPPERTPTSTPSASDPLPSGPDAPAPADGEDGSAG